MDDAAGESVDGGQLDDPAHEDLLRAVPARTRLAEAATASTEAPMRAATNMNTLFGGEPDIGVGGHHHGCGDQRREPAGRGGPGREGQGGVADGQEQQHDHRAVDAVVEDGEGPHREGREDGPRLGEPGSPRLRRHPRHQGQVHGSRRDPDDGHRPQHGPVRAAGRHGQIGGGGEGLSQEDAESRAEMGAPEDLRAGVVAVQPVRVVVPPSSPGAGHRRHRARDVCERPPVRRSARRSPNMRSGAGAGHNASVPGR